MNYNDLGLSLNYDNINVDFNYLQEDKHIGNQEYFKTKINLLNGENRAISFDTKRNLIKNSSEYYNLSYEYINDCLRAGLVYRREFYNDSELEPENSLMFKITITSFGEIDLRLLADDEKTLFFFLFFLYFFQQSSFASVENSIVVKIDNQIITNFEIKIKSLYPNFI